MAETRQALIEKRQHVRAEILSPIEPWLQYRGRFAQQNHPADGVDLRRIGHSDGNQTAAEGFGVAQRLIERRFDWRGDAFIEEVLAGRRSGESGVRGGRGLRR